jgi:sialidase-1
MRMFDQQVLYRCEQDGYRLYRIPALAVTKAGTVLAFCEGRKDSWADTCEIHLLLRRSGDGGRTWSDRQIVVQEKDVTCGNPCPVVDHAGGTICLFFCKNPRLAGGTDLVAGGQGTRTVWLTRSDDDGLTWSQPADMTATLKKADWTWYATGPGHGVQLSSGRLIVPCTHQVAVNMKADDPNFAHVVYSDDGGRTWALGGKFGPGCDESSVVQTADGSVYLNARNQAEVGHRAFAFSRDGGLSFGPRQMDDTLIEPTLWKGCEASLARYRVSGPGEFGATDCVLFANPATGENERKNMAVRVSRDQCETWSDARTIHAGPAAYSDLTVAPDGTVLCMYECGDENPYQSLTLARFDLEWVLGR